MPSYVWCKKEECRLPTFRCLLCQDRCDAGREGIGAAEEDLDALVKSGKYKERYVMKRKPDALARDEASPKVVSTGEARDPSKNIKEAEESKVFLMEDGKLRPLSAGDYTAATLYQMVESYSVECRLVRPEETANLVFEGKKPSKKTVPIILTKDGHTQLLESWEKLDSNPEQLADAVEVLGATPVKQVFVLKRKED